MKTFKTVRWGIIGVGDVTEIKSGPAFYKIEQSSVVAVMRRDAEKAADYARRHQVPKWYSNGSELINAPDVDAIYVATPPDSHADYAIEAMRAGKPVYVEKPMARTHAECERMLEVSRETGMPLWVAYYRRALPAFLEAIDVLESGQIGKAVEVNIRLFKQAVERGQEKEAMGWRVDSEVAGAGHFFDLASHQFDYLDFVFGKVVEVEGKATNLGGLYAAEDTVSGSWVHESGVRGRGSWSFIADEDSERDEIEIVAENGTIKLSSFENPGIIEITSTNGHQTNTFENPQHISQNLVQQLVDELRGVGICVSTGQSAARTSWVLDEMVKDYYAGRTT